MTSLSYPSRLILYTVLLCMALTLKTSWATPDHSATAYLNRFYAYLLWSENLPNTPTVEFIKFIQGNKPLAKKLREKWLYHLAQSKNWDIYTNYYQPSDDISLQCYALTAQCKHGNCLQALPSAKKLWLKDHTLPPACNELFTIIAQEDTHEAWISKRVHLTLEKGYLHLTRHLLKQYKKPKIYDANLITAIHLHPMHISQLNSGQFHGAFYLYGLKRLIPINLKHAIRMWNEPKTKIILNDAQQQSFLASVALYKAMHNQEDATHWFERIKPAYYSEALLEWRIRHALLHHHWKKVENLIHYSPAKDTPIWQYWLARALSAQGKQEEANELYQKLAQERHYYGFLSSSRLKKPFHFKNEKASPQSHLLKPYQSFLEKIRTLAHAKHLTEASRLLNDFVLELPKEEKSALAFWLSYDLHWHGKALAISNHEDLYNQLSLRFPLVHEKFVKEFAGHYNLSPAFVYAIMRQESTFIEDIVSPAGAHGLMQLMPRTAQTIAKLEKIAYGNKVQLFSAQKNIHIGTAYLHQLATRFHAHPVLISAAYNAGPKQVVHWLKDLPTQEIDLWIETLPWRETRNYIKNVVASSVVYQYRMQQKADLHEFLQEFPIS